LPSSRPAIYKARRSAAWSVGFPIARPEAGEAPEAAAAQLALAVQPQRRDRRRHSEALLAHCIGA